jgi:hypothetical protein
MENLNQFEGKKRSAGEELVYNQTLEEKKEGKGGKNKKNKNKRDKKQKQNQEVNLNEDKNIEEKENNFGEKQTAKSFNFQRDLKSEKFEFYYRVRLNFI